MLDAEFCAPFTSLFQVVTWHIKKPLDDYLEGVLTTVYHILLFEEDPGDILVFLTGEEVWTSPVRGQFFCNFHAIPQNFSQLITFFFGVGSGSV